MSESLFIMLQNSKHLDHTTRINGPLLIVRNIDTCNKSYSDGNSFLGDNASSGNFTPS
jgi:hypothetical protein